jgi:hypothetical protein
MTTSLIKTFLASIFLVFGIFFTMFPHTIHCNVIKYFDMNCVPHKIHIFMGIIFFFLAVYIQQSSYIDHN